MTDSSSPNPSDQRNPSNHGNAFPESREGDNPQPKLKLKQLLTPLSPHLNVESSEHEKSADEYRPKMEIPRAVPIDPEPELAPHERPPAPDGSPLVPGEMQLGPDGHPLPNPAMEPPVFPPPNEQQGIPEETGENEEEIEELVSAPAPESGRFKKIALPVVGLLLVIAAVQYFLDPLGLSIDP